MLLTDGSRPVEWCSDALRLHAGTPAASAPTGRKRPSQEKKTTKAKKKTKKTNEEDEEDDDATYDESDEEEELVLDETSDDDDNDDDVDDDVDDKPKVGESRAFCVCLLTTHTTRRAVATYSALALQLGKTKVKERENGEKPQFNAVFSPFVFVHTAVQTAVFYDADSVRPYSNFMIDEPGNKYQELTPPTAEPSQSHYCAWPQN
jgi:hypothetical protein